MQMSVASLLFLCRIESDCDLFLINWTAEWLEDKGYQHFSFSFFPALYFFFNKIKVLLETLA